MLNFTGEIYPERKSRLYAESHVGKSHTNIQVRKRVRVLTLREWIRLYTIRGLFSRDFIPWQIDKSSEQTQV